MKVRATTAYILKRNGKPIVKVEAPSAFGVVPKIKAAWLKFFINDALMKQGNPPDGLTS